MTDPKEGQRLQSGDLFRIAIPRNPQISPDRQFVLYLREQPDIQTDQLVTTLQVLSLSTLEHLSFIAEMPTQFACWAPDGSIIAIRTGFDGITGALCQRIHPHDGSSSVISNLPVVPGQMALSRDGEKLAMLINVPVTPHGVVLPDQPTGATWSPRARYIDRTVWRLDGVGELHGHDQIFVLDIQSGNIAQITDDLRSVNCFPAGIDWSADGKQILFTSILRKDWELEQFNTDICAVDLASKQSRSLTTRFGPDLDPKMSPNGDWIAYRGFDDEKRYYTAPSLYIMRPDGSGVRKIADVGQGIGSHIWRTDGNGLYFSYVRDGSQRLALVDWQGAITELACDLASDGPFDVEPYLMGSSSFCAAAGGVVATIGAPGDPGQLVFIEDAGATKPLTTLNADWLPAVELGKVERMDYSSTDGVAIQAWLIYPPGYDPLTPHPLVLNIHGGPDLAYGSQFSFRFQRYAANGYVVLLVNYRGSLGTDMGFYDSPWEFPGKEFDDLMAGVEAAQHHASIDPGRLFVTGLSAGGVLTAWTIGKTTRFAAAAVHSPIINWIGYAVNNDLYSSFGERCFKALPWEDPMIFWRTSPLSLAGNVQTPTLIIHGEEDSRTPPSEGFQLYHALKLRRIPTAMVLLPVAFHIPTRPTQWIEEQQFILEWFDKYGQARNFAIADYETP